MQYLGPLGYCAQPGLVTQQKGRLTLRLIWWNCFFVNTRVLASVLLKDIYNCLSTPRLFLSSSYPATIIGIWNYPGGMARWIIRHIYWGVSLSPTLLTQECVDETLSSGSVFPVEWNSLSHFKNSELRPILIIFRVKDLKRLGLNYLFLIF